MKDDLVDLETELVDLVKTINSAYDKEDRQERDKKRPLWMKLENYYHGLQRIYWNAVAKDYRFVDNNGDLSGRHYDKIINIYKSHADSIIAALSIKTPSAIFYPADAEVEEDIVTSKACLKIKKDIEKFNFAQLLIIKSLLILFNQGVVAAYIYNRKSKNYGTYSKPKYEGSIKNITVLSNCAECGSNLGETVFTDKVGKIPEEPIKCPVCGYEGVPVNEEYEETLPNIIGSIIENKSKTCIEVFSPLFVYIPFYARKQEDIPYLRLRFEQHYSALKNMYSKLKKKGFTPRVDTQNSDERSINVDLNDTNLCTVDCWWVRPWAYDLIDDKSEQIKKLKSKFPDGYYAICIDGQLVEICNESLDEHWSISQNPLSTYIHSDPLGKVLAPIQDLENEVVDLQIETFEHAIPETHARADVVDFKKYGEEKAQPGMLYPANPPPDGTSLNDAFHTIKTATLSEESDLFLKRLDEKAQFVTKSFPSIYGGPATSGSKTAREYIESRSMALQSLGLTWNVEKYWWADVMSKAVPLRIHSLRQSGMNEKIVEKSGTGFINNWINQEDLNGNIGSVEADTDEEMPLSPIQLKSMITELMALKDENLNEALYHPQNTPLVRKALSAPDFYIPGSDERDKQYAEFIDLLNGIPVEVRPWESHEIEAETCKAFLNSPTGLILKKNNLEGWTMIEEHMMSHLEAGMVEASKEAATSPGALNPEGGSANG